MRRILYFDTFNGVAGDMILGSLLDMGLPLDYLLAELSKLEVGGYSLEAEPVQRQGLSGTNFHVRLSEERAESPSAGQSHPHLHPHLHSHEGAHGHKAGSPHVHEPPAEGDPAAGNRGLGEIERIIRTSGLSETVRERSVRIFQRLAQAEAKVHGTPVDEVHFHEVGGVDAIVDIVGACIGFDYFRVADFYTGPINLGGGTVTFSHGSWPVPAPATAELVKGFPTLLGTVQAELTTPTGAAIVTTLAQAYARPPVCSYVGWGYGAGDRELSDIPNMLRLMLGELPEASSSGPLPVGEEEVVVLEATIDDMDAQSFGYFLPLALKRGALDVYYIPAQMKKNRPGVLLTLLCHPVDHDRMVELLFEETTTLGIRSATSRRLALRREVVEKQTEHGPVRVKVGRFGKRVVSVSPEYEDVKSIAEKTGKPLKTVRRDLLERLGKPEDYE